jgi:hypothetical protein
MNAAIFRECPYLLSKTTRTLAIVCVRCIARADAAKRLSRQGAAGAARKLCATAKSARLRKLSIGVFREFAVERTLRSRRGPCPPFVEHPSGKRQEDERK